MEIKRVVCEGSACHIVEVQKGRRGEVSQETKDTKLSQLSAGLLGTETGNGNGMETETVKAPFAFGSVRVRETVMCWQLSGSFLHTTSSFGY